MTKAMRWGVSALLILGGVGVGSFMGCSSDDEPGPVDTGDTGTGDDTSVDTGTDTGSAEETSTDTGSDDTGTKTDAPTDAPVFHPDRAVSLLMAAPDLPPQYLCLGAFVAGAAADVASKTAPDSARLIGIPDPSAPTDETKYSPFPYGTAVQIPLDSLANAALKNFTVVVWFKSAKPATDCKADWATAKADTTKWKAFDKDTIKKDDHALLAISGCAGAGTAMTSECGAGSNLKIDLLKADTTKATTFAGESTGPKVGIDFINLSRYVGAGTPPSWQGIDAYLVFSKSVGVTLDAGTDDSGDATTADGGTSVVPDVAKAVKIADNKSYGDIVSVVGVQAGDLADVGTYLVVVPHGASLATSPPCSSAPGPTCAAYIPFKPFIDSLKVAGAGFKDMENQFVALAGGPIPKSLTDAGTPDPTSAPVRILMGNADKPAP